MEGGFIISTQECATFDPDGGDVEAQIERLKRQTWIIENTPFTDEQYIIRATCTDRAIIRYINQETIDHSSDTICGVCRFKHFDLKLVDITECVGDNEFGNNECLHFLETEDL